MVATSGSSEVCSGSASPERKKPLHDCHAQIAIYPHNASRPFHRDGDRISEAARDKQAPLPVPNPRTASPAEKPVQQPPPSLRQAHHTSLRSLLGYMYAFLQKDPLRGSRRIAISMKPAVHQEVKSILAPIIKHQARVVQAFVPRCQTSRVGDGWTGRVERVDLCWGVSQGMAGGPLQMGFRGDHGGAISSLQGSTRWPF